MFCHRCTKTPQLITSYNLILHAQCLYTGMNKMEDSSSHFCRLLELLQNSHKLPFIRPVYLTADMQHLTQFPHLTLETHLQHYKI